MTIRGAITMTMMAAGVTACVAACAPLPDDNEEIGESPESLTATQSLVAQGYVYKRRDRFAYEREEGATASGMVCVGGPEGRICYDVYRDGGKSVVKGSAARYEHPDGRIAYVKGTKIVGPVRPGFYSGSMHPIDKRGQRIGPMKWTVRVLDLTLGAYGTFPVVLEAGVDAMVNDQPRAFGEAATLDFSTSRHPSYPSSTVFGSFATPRLGTEGTQQVVFGATGDITRYDWGYHYDSSLRASALSLVDPARAPVTCATPYRCLKAFDAWLPWDAGSYPSRAACEASCVARGTRAQCAPSEIACE